MADSKSAVREAQALGSEDNWVNSRAKKTKLMQKLARNSDLSGPLPPGAVSTVPTNTLLLSNVWSASDISQEQFFDTIHKNINIEMKKYGNVERIHIEEQSETGNVWVRFREISEAKKA